MTSTYRVIASEAKQSRPRRGTSCFLPASNRCAPGQTGRWWRRRSLGRNAMPTQIGENHAKRMLKANELVLCMGVNQLRTPNIAMIAAACGFDAVYVDLEHNPTSLETAAGVCVSRHWVWG